MENSVKAMIYRVNHNTIIDKRSGKEVGLININYITPNTYENDNALGWTSCQCWLTFTDELWNELKGLLLKNITLTFSLRPDYKDSTKYSSKLIKINDFVIKP